MKKNIVLTGFMGSGKSSVGTKLAERLNCKFIDMDREIEKICGMSISDLFKRYGERRFRSEEMLMAKKLSEQSGLVIATGGGVVLQEENMESLRENGIIISLEASPENIYQRVSRKKGSRPLLKKNLTVEDIVEMLENRKGLYKQADFIVDTSEKSINEVVDQIISFIRSHEK